MRLPSAALPVKTAAPPPGSEVLRRLTLGLGLAGAVLFSTVAGAAGGKMSDAQARYQSERAACMNGQSNQDRATCLQEAGAALREARRGNLVDGDVQQKDRNNLSRCDALPAQDREDCVRRMSGDGVTRGNAANGGIYRELTRPVAPEAAK